MAGGSNKVRRKGANSGSKANGKQSGFTVDAGPYEATVLGHVKGTRMGELKVSIPDWPGTDSLPDDGITVSYASPFYGTTFGADTQLAPNTPTTSGQSYGMWFVPPDIGNTVLVFFCAGDLDRGYWFACAYDSPSHHMVPGNGRNVGGDNNVLTPSDSLGSMLTGDSNIPVQEFDTSDPQSYTADGIVNTKRFPHEFQTSILISQGLIGDKVRGAISSSSVRESPSNVYGISTPGPKGTKGDQAPNADAIFFRKGGHTFVMDDGDKDGNDQLIRLRTSGGHQILMNDSVKYTNKNGQTYESGILYIASKTGNQWLEFSADGSINIFGVAGINMRSEGPMNFHSDASITMNASSINMVAQGGKGLAAMGNNITMRGMNISLKAIENFSAKSNAMMNLSSMGLVNMSGGYSVTVGSLGKTSVSGTMLLLNTPPGLSVPPLPVLPPMAQTVQDTILSGGNWVPNLGALQTACSVVPCHEPWVDADGNRPKAAAGSAGAAIVSGIL